VEDQNYQEVGKETKKLYRSRRNKVISGVCGGLSEYFEVDVAIIRILMVLLTLVQGAGLIIYIVALFVIPINPNDIVEPGSTKTSGNRGQGFVLLIGVLLILIGAYYTFGNFVIFPTHIFYSFPFDFRWDLVLPILLILGGVLYIIHVSQKSKAAKGQEIEPTAGTSTEPTKRFTRSRIDKKISGVCGGIAAYFDIDPTIVRILWIIFTIFVGTILLGIIIYVVLAIVLPEGD